MTALNGWHRGERLVRQKLGFDKIPSTALLYTQIKGDMPEQHSTFYSSRLQFLPVCIVDEENRPWGSILAGRGGNLGFIQHPKYNTLTIETKLWEGEPFIRHLKALDHGNGSSLIAGIGVEVSTRRRNKFAGMITKTEVKGDNVNLELVVNEALGNCPKYITLRELVPHPLASCVVLEDRPHLSMGDRLSDEAITFVLESDTVFFGTTYVASKDEFSAYPSHLGMNHRGGRVGFIRVKPSDGRTVVLPDFSGNRFMSSLGNVEASPLASLTFISFTTGNVLYLTGQARNLYGSEARAVMPFQDTLTEIYVTGYTFVSNAFPARQKPGYQIQASPYSPPIRFLAEEETHAKLFGVEGQPTALLTRITIHSSTIATFDWESSLPLHIAPGQAVIMDFSTLLGSREYQHMSARKPSLLNDDFIRTWTVSSSTSVNSDSRLFSLTMREKPGGIVTGALFNILRKLSQYKQEALEDSRVLSLSVNIVGVSGDFVLPQLRSAPSPSLSIDSEKIGRLVWITGGIGITPFLSMLAALSKVSEPPPWDIVFLVSTREPDVMLSLVTLALGGMASPPYLSMHIFTGADISEKHSNLGFVRHNGRIELSFFKNGKDLFGEKDSEVFLCGSDPFERFVLDSLAKLGVGSEKVHREGFAY